VFIEAFSGIYARGITPEFLAILRPRSRSREISGARARGLNRRRAVLCSLSSSVSSHFFTGDVGALVPLSRELLIKCVPILRA
jgi:hypothetical protein